MTMPATFWRFCGIATSSLRPYLPVSLFSVPTRTALTLNVGSVTSRNSLPLGPLKARMVGVTWLPVDRRATAEPLPIREPDGQLVGLVWTTDWRQLANLELPKTRFLSKWMTARRVANGASVAAGVVAVTTVMRPTLRGLLFVPARFVVVFTEIVCVPLIANATAVMPSTPTTAATHTSATLRMLSPPGRVRKGDWLTG